MFRQCARCLGATAKATALDCGFSIYFRPKFRLLQGPFLPLSGAETMPKTVLDKVLAAIGTLAEPGGASRPAIAKAVSAADGEVGAALLKAALSKGVAKGLLTQAGQRFALAGVTVAPREVAQVDSVVLKEGSGDPCGAGDTVSMAYVGSLQVGRHSAHDCMHTARTPGRCRRSTSRRRVELSSAHS